MSACLELAMRAGDAGRRLDNSGGWSKVETRRGLFMSNLLAASRDDLHEYCELVLCQGLIFG